MHNIEYKAELRDLTLARSIARAHGATFIDAVEQTDTYFRIPTGRLKKREVPGEETEYIFYDRENRAAAKLSSFTIYSEAQALERFGVSPLPVWVVVRKAREIYIVGNVRIHLDTVDGLGQFLEFEAVVSPAHDSAQCHRSVATLKQVFAPVLGEAVACSYSDLLAAEHELRSMTDERAGQA